MICTAFAVFCVFFAYVNYRVIEIANEHIRHGVNGLFCALTSLYCFLHVDTQTGFQILLTGRLFFDVTLNLFRGKKIYYVTPEPKSLVDKAEQFIFKKNGWLPKLIYFIALIVLFYI
jgi:hypothetical protein